MGNKFIPFWLMIPLIHLLGSCVPRFCRVDPKFGSTGPKFQMGEFVIWYNKPTSFYRRLLTSMTVVTNNTVTVILRMYGVRLKKKLGPLKKMRDSEIKNGLTNV